MKPLSLALIGREISYSKSPEIFEAIFKHDRVCGEFALKSVEPEALGRWLREAAESGLDGLAVTIPYKAAVISLLDELDPTARIIGAVNCVAIKGRRLHGFNTDWIGFARLIAAYKADVSGGSAVIAGAGGAARAVVYALHHDYDIRRFVVLGRSAQALKQLKDYFEQVLEGSIVDIVTPGDSMPASLPSRTIAVNCTPLGGWREHNASPWRADCDWSRVAVYVDLNYNEGNRLVAEARSKGIAALDGSAMLIAQALEAYAVWTGRTVPFDPVYEAVFGGSGAG